MFLYKQLLLVVFTLLVVSCDNNTPLPNIVNHSITANATLKLNGIPEIDVDLVVDKEINKATALLRTADALNAHLYRFDINGSMIEKSNLNGTIVKGLDPIADPNHQFFAAATKLANHKGAIHLWSHNEASVKQIDLPGRPKEDVDLVIHPNNWLLLPVQGDKAQLIQLNPDNQLIVQTRLKGYLYSGVDAAIAPNNKDILLPTIDPKLKGSFIERIEPITGKVVASIDLPGLLVADQDLIISDNTGFIALTSFDGSVGFLAIVDLINNSANIICLPGSPIAGIDPRYIKSQKKVAIVLNNQHGLFDHLVIVDPLSQSVEMIDLPDNARADVDIIISSDENYLVTSSESHLLRVDLNDYKNEYYPLPGYVTPSTDMRLLADGQTILLPVQADTLLGAASLVRFNIPSATVTTETLTNQIEPGIDLLPITQGGELLLASSSHDAQHTSVNRWTIANDHLPEFVLATRERGSNKSQLLAKIDDQIQTFPIDGILVAAVDTLFSNDSFDQGLDEDYIPNDGSCSIHDSNPDQDNNDDPDKQNGEEDPPLIWIPGNGPGEITDQGLVNLIGNHMTEIPDEGSSSTSYDDVIFSGFKDQQNQLSAKTFLVDSFARKIKQGPQMSTPRNWHSSKILASGDVLFAGGRNSAGKTLKSAELFDSQTEQIRPLPDMKFKRAGGRATLLTKGVSSAGGSMCGGVLMTGGEKDQPQGGSEPEVEILIGGNWLPGGKMNHPRAHHQAVLAPNGHVWIFGGENNNAPVAEVEVYDPSKREFTVVGQLLEPRSHFSAVSFHDGRVVLVGGETFSPDQAEKPRQPIASVELWNINQTGNGSEGQIIAELPLGLAAPIAYQRGANSIHIAGGNSVEGSSPMVFETNILTGRTTTVSRTGPTGVRLYSVPRRKPIDDENSIPPIPPEEIIPREAGPVRTTDRTRTRPPIEPNDTEEQDNGSTGPSEAGDPVHLSSGEFFIREIDYTLTGRAGMDLDFIRTYKSKIDFLGSLGHGWDHNFNERLLNGPLASKELHTGGGAIAVYKRNSDGSFQSPRGSFDELRMLNNGEFVLRDRYGEKKYFSKVGRLLKKQDRFGNQLNFEYNSQGHLAKVIDVYLRTLRFHYDDRGLLVKLKDFSDREVIYQYNESQELISVTTHAVKSSITKNDFPKGKTTRYTYACHTKKRALCHNLLTMTMPNEVASGGPPVLVNYYNEDEGSYSYDKIVKQFYGGTNNTGIAAGGEIRYQYEAVNKGADDSDLNIIRNRTRIVDRNNTVTIYEHNIAGAELFKRQLAGNHRPIDDNLIPAWATDPSEIVVQRHYNKNGLLQTVTHPMGNKIEYNYDDSNPDELQRGNILSQSLIVDQRGGKNEVTTFSYEPIYNQIKSILSPNGNDPTTKPRIGNWSKSRYTTQYRFDYQEGKNLAALALETGRSESKLQALLSTSGVALNIGDINNDGLTNQISGSIIQHIKPSIHLPSWSTQRVVENGSLQNISIYYRLNHFGQIIEEIDPNGNIKRYSYYSASDPDGDGHDIKQTLASTGGYLKSIIKDADTSPNRITSKAPRKIKTTFKYSATGHKISVTDARGNTTKTIINERGQILRSITAAPQSYETDYHYDANDNLIRIDIQNIRQNKNGNERLVSENSELTTFNSYDILDQLVTVKEEVTAPVVANEPIPTEIFRYIQYRYDGNGNKTEIHAPDGIIDKIEYDAFDRSFKVIKAYSTADEATETIHYDRNGSIILTIDAQDNGKPGSFSGDPTFTYYDGNDREIAVVDALGNISEKAYDAHGNVIWRKLYDGQDARNPSLKYRGHNGLLIAHSKHYYDESNQLFESEDLLFDAQSPSVTSSVFLRNEFDRLGLVVREIDQDGESVFRSYDGTYSLFLEQDDAGNKTEYFYDDAHNNIKITTTEIPDSGFGTPTVRSQYAVFDQQNRKIRASNSIGETSYFHYDSRGNLVRELDSLAAKITDPLNFVPTKINAPGNATEFYFDALSRTTITKTELTTNPQGSGNPTPPTANSDGQITEKRIYDLRGNLISVTDDPDIGGTGSTTLFEYDYRGREKLEINADGSRIATLWDDDNNRVQVTDGNGSQFFYSYDDLHRNTNIGVIPAPGIIGTTKQSFKFNGRSQIIETSDNNNPNDPLDDHKIVYQYNSLSQKVQEKQDNYLLKASYDNENTLSSITHSDGVIIHYERDKIDRIRNIKRESSAGAILQLAEFKYVERNKVTRIDFANGTHSKIQYDQAARLQRLSYLSNTSTSPAIYDTSYLYDRNSRRIASIYHHKNNSGDVYQYDSAGRLTQTDYSVPRPMSELAAPGSGGQANMTERYELDGAGNHKQVRIDELTTTHTDFYISNMMNEYREVNGVRREYDTNGSPKGDDRRRYYFDAFDRLVKVTDPQNNQVKVLYSYDSSGRRLSADYLDINGQTKALSLVYWQEQVLEEWTREANPSMLARFSTNFFQQTKDTNDLDGDGDHNEWLSYFVYKDVLGSAVVAIDANAQIIERYKYTAYGHPTISNNDETQTYDRSLVGNRNLFTSYRYEYETNLHFATSRDFDSDLRRFVQRDPIGLLGGSNLYQYAQSDPINLVDPLGTSSVAVSSAPGAFKYLSGTKHPQISKSAASLYEIMRQKEMLLYKKFKNNPGLLQFKIGKLEKLFFDIAKSMVRRHNAWVDNYNDEARKKAGWHFDTDKLRKLWEPLATAASFLPFVGDIFDTIGLAVGFDITTLEWLTPGERALMGAGLLIGSGAAMVKAFRAAKKLAKGADKMGDARKALKKPRVCSSGGCPSGSTSCFLAGTLVLAMNATAAIENISVGDPVQTWNLSEQTVQEHKIQETYVRDVDEIIYLSVDNGTTTEVIGVTGEHPFWVVDEGWLHAEKLRIGDRLKTVDSNPAQITATRKLSGSFKVYNLNVSTIDNYYVGKSKLLVHNANYTSNPTGKDLGVPDDNFVPDSSITKKYKRPTGQTKAQKDSVQGKPCVVCGTVTNKQVADHKDPLVVEYWRTGKNDLAHQRSVNAVQPHCPTCSRKQGGYMSAFSKKMKNLLGL